MILPVAVERRASDRGRAGERTAAASCWRACASSLLISTGSWCMPAVIAGQQKVSLKEIGGHFLHLTSHKHSCDCQPVVYEHHMYRTAAQSRLLNFAFTFDYQ
eukprot:1495002-Pleurochrysis_carterae.AAC.3